MAISIRNLEKFFRDHPEYSHLKKKILTQAEKDFIEGLIPETKLYVYLGELSTALYNEVYYNQDHLKITYEDLGKLYEDPNGIVDKYLRSTV